MKPTSSRLPDLLATEPEATGGKTLTQLYDLLAAARGPSSPGEIRIKLTNSTQGAHLFQTLRGHCEVDMLSGSEGTAVVVWSSPSGSRPILRRLNAWLSDFGVDTISIELNGRTYEMRKTVSPTIPSRTVRAPNRRARAAKL